jgi:transposase
MAHRYIPVRRDQSFLLPVNMADWLEEGHLAHFVIEVVDRLDTAALHARHPNDGPGRPAYDPDLMLGLVLYGYATGVRSSRRLEACCRTDAAFKVIAAGLVPDHATIARFVVDHQAAMEGLFVAGLRLLERAGLVDLSVVAIDGTKLAANAALRANHPKEWILAQVKALLAAIAASEAAEAGAPGDGVGGVDVLSAAQITGAVARRSRLDAAVAAIDAEEARSAEEAARHSAAARRAAAAGRRLRGKKPTADPQAALARAEADYEATVAKAAAKAARRAATEAAAAAAGRKPKGPAPKQDRSVEAAALALAAARSAAAAATATKDRKTRANVTDADSRIMATRKGYLQGYNAQVAVTSDQVVVGLAVTNEANDVGQLEAMLETLAASTEALGMSAGQIGTVLADAGYWSETNARLAGRADLGSPDLLIATIKDWKQRRAAREAGTTVGEPPEGASALEAMEHRLRTAEGAAAYARRSSMVEPVFGDEKHNAGFDRFQRRGLPAVRAEWALMNLVKNLVKLHRHRALPPRLDRSAASQPVPRRLPSLWGGAARHAPGRWRRARR